jgi:prophage regulatory protein
LRGYCVAIACAIWVRRCFVRSVSSAYVYGWARTNGAAGAKVMKSVNRVITMRDLYDYVALRRTQIEKLVAEGRFPKPIKISDRRKAWLESEVQAWLAERIAARDNAA